MGGFMQILRLDAMYLHTILFNLTLFMLFHVTFDISFYIKLTAVKVIKSVIAPSSPVWQNNFAFVKRLVVNMQVD